MKLINGDCIEELKHLENNSIDCIITSPPYFNVKEYSHFNSYVEYLEWLQQVFTINYNILKPGKMCCVNISTIIIPRKHRQDESKRIALPFHFVCLMEKIGFKFLEDIQWIKPDGSVPNRNGGFYQHRKPLAYKPNCVNEYVFVFQKPCNCLLDDIIKSYPEKVILNSKVNRDYEKTNIWNINPEPSEHHPAPFPLELPTKLIQYYSYEMDLILDPFMGSGTTGVACRNLNREFIGIELNKQYYDVACNRIDIYQTKLI